jgi:hypothetical protein
MQVAGVAWSWLMSNGGILTSGISGLFSIFSEHKTGRLWKVLPIIGVVAGMVWALASASFVDHQQQKKMGETINKVDDYIQKQSSQTNQHVDASKDEIVSLLHVGFGIKLPVAESKSTEQLSALVTAGKSANAIVQSISPERRQALTIWVFPHLQQEVDFNVVKSRLQQLAATVLPHAPKQGQSQTNSVWWSDGVTLDEAKAAALIVTSAGLQIRQICPSETVQMKNLIQIGGSLKAEKENMPVLSPQQIQLLQSPVCQKEKQF